METRKQRPEVCVNTEAERLQRARTQARYISKYPSASHC